MNENQSTIRQPKQKRSIEKKKLIQVTALNLFCNFGFYSVTTNQIAKEAGLSVGTLYGYYENKEDILYDILDDYYNEILNHKDQLFNLIKQKAHLKDKREWLEDVLQELIQAHRASLQFNIELQTLYFRLDAVKEVCTKQRKLIQNVVYESLCVIKDQLIVTDIETASILFCDIVSSVVDRIVLYPTQVQEEKIISESIDLLSMYLFGVKDFNE